MMIDQLLWLPLLCPNYPLLLQNSSHYNKTLHFSNNNTWLSHQREKFIPYTNNCQCHKSKDTLVTGIERKEMEI